jgi:hypothetical protein
MVQQSFSTGGTASSPFTSFSGRHYLSRYRAARDYLSPLSGAFPATGTPGYAVGAGVVGTTEVLRSDELNYRPIMFYSISVPFTNASSVVTLQITTESDGTGGVNGPDQGDASTVTWDTDNTTTALQYAVSSVGTGGTSDIFYVGFRTEDTNTTTFRRGASSDTFIAANGILVNGVSEASWANTAVRTTIRWRHSPNHPTSLSATGGTNPGEVNLSWVAPTDDGGEPMYGYRIAYKKTGTSTWFVYGTNTYRSPSNTLFGATTEVVRGLDPGAEYSFVIAALNGVTDRYEGGRAHPDPTYADYTLTTAHTGQNSNIATGTATALGEVTPKFGAYSTALSKFLAAQPKVRNASSTFVDGTPWIYDGSKWNRPLQVAGGTTSTYTSGGITYTLHTFSSSSNLYVRECQAGLSVTYLVVGGGGGGGGKRMGGGGGAGGVLTGTMTLSSNTIYAVEVGVGGAGGGEATKGVTGEDSFFNSIVAKGGGGGGSWEFAEAGDSQGLPGGSGGGNSGYRTSAAGLGTAGQGNNGGVGAEYGGGGGGGAGAVGSNGTSSTGGDGGVGVSNSITGSAVFYGGGGGGASYTSTTVPQGGNGGGGNGAPGPNNSSGGIPTDGTDGRGGGGGGANGYGTVGDTVTGGDGGDGVVIIRYISSIT